MTDKEREELCDELRYPSLHTVLETCDKAANEIKWLAKEVARLKDENGVIREQCQNMLDMTVR